MGGNQIDGRFRLIESDLFSSKPTNRFDSVTDEPIHERPYLVTLILVWGS